MNIFRTRVARRLQQALDEHLAAEVASSVGLADTSDLSLMRDNAARLTAAGVTRTLSTLAPTAQPTMPTLGFDGRRNSPTRRTPTQGNNVVAIRRNPPPPPPAAARPTWLTKTG